VLTLCIGLFALFGCGKSKSPTALMVTLIIDPNPDIITAEWTLTGPDLPLLGVSGAGDTTFTDLSAGCYTVTWSDSVGGGTWQAPSRNPHTYCAPEGVTYAFVGNFVSLGVTAYINPQPEDIRGIAGWDLEGPNGYSLTGAGPDTVASLETGSYTISWHQIVGWQTPVDQTQSGSEGELLTFTGLYELIEANTIVVDPNPNILDAPWNLQGPSGYNLDGNGDLTLREMTPGTYTLTWGLVDTYEYPDPNPDVRELEPDSSLTFRGNYHRFVLITPDQFQMGSPNDEPGRFTRENNRHLVTLTRPYYISKTEVTQAEFMSVLGDSIDNPSYFQDCDDCPVEGVSWWTAIVYCNYRSEMEGYEPVYDLSNPEEGILYDPTKNGYRLPTEAEWEFACRAGSDTPFANGDIGAAAAADDEFDCSADSTLGLIGWYCANSDGATHEIATLAPNALGIFDMHGNVWEWCWDYYAEYEGGPEIDPTGPVEGTSHVLRGGAWNLRARCCRSAMRGLGQIAKRLDPDPATGFRLARTAE